MKKMSCFVAVNLTVSNLRSSVILHSIDWFRGQPIGATSKGQADETEMLCCHFGNYQSTPQKIPEARMCQPIRCVKNKYRQQVPNTTILDISLGVRVSGKELFIARMNVYIPVFPSTGKSQLSVGNFLSNFVLIRQNFTKTCLEKSGFLERGLKRRTIYVS